jgi:hypothetical protein
MILSPKIYENLYGVFNLLCYIPAPLMDRNLL